MRTFTSPRELSDRKTPLLRATPDGLMQWRPLYQPQSRSERALALAGRGFRGALRLLEVR